MTKKTEKSAQTVEKSTQKPEDSKATPKKPPKKATVKPSLFDLSKTDPKAIEAAEAMGLPIRKLAAWAEKVEATQEAQGKAITLIAENMPTEERIRNALVQTIEAKQKEAREAYAKAMQQQGQPQMPMRQGGGGITIADLLQYAPMVLGGGGSSEFDKMLREMGMENMLLGREIIRQTFTRGAKDILDRVDAKMAEFKAKKSEG